MNGLLARLVPILLAPLVAPSCLVTAKQDFPAPPQTPPFLSASGARPSLQHLHVLDGTQTLEFSTSVRSEDDGVPLEVLLIVDDIFANPPVIIDHKFVGASTFNDTGREISVRFDPAVPPLTKVGSVTPGCHRFTLLVSHNFIFRSDQPAIDGDQDFLVWWVVQGNPKDASFADTVAAAGCP